MMNKKTLKKIVRQLRAKPKRELRLIDMLINTKSYLSPYWVKDRLKNILLDRTMDREYGIKAKVLDYCRESCYSPSHYRHYRGNRTYFIDGKYYPYNPNDELPF